MDTEAEIRGRLQACEHVVFALLFGSRAPSGRPRQGSDRDLAVYLGEGLGPAERLAARLGLATELSDPGHVDLVVLNDAPALLAHRALQGGRPLLARDPGAYVRFFVRTPAASGDEAYWRRFHEQARRRRLEEGRHGRP
jgi:predicted nucleotidyltransferase